MAYGDANYVWVNSGSTGASADTAHGLFGIYGGLSSLHESEVLHVQVQGITNSLKVGPDNTLTNDTGFKVGTTAWEDLPPMRTGAASGFHFINETAGTDTSPMWVIWRRKPL